MTPLIAPLVLAVIAGPVGCLIVWRRMAYFGDAIAHSALLGVAVGLFIGFAFNIGVALISAFFGIAGVSPTSTQTGIDTLLGISSRRISFRIVAGLWSAVETGHGFHNEAEHKIDPHQLLETYLLGSLENISMQPNITLIISAIVIGIILKLIWEPLILMTLNMDLAMAEKFRRYAFNIL